MIHLPPYFLFYWDGDRYLFLFDDIINIQYNVPHLNGEFLIYVWQETAEMPLDTGSIDVQSKGVDNNAAGGSCNQNQMSEEQKARMEANKLKALERAAARSRSIHTWGPFLFLDSCFDIFVLCGFTMLQSC